MLRPTASGRVAFSAVAGLRRHFWSLTEIRMDFGTAAVLSNLLCLANSEVEGSA